MPSSNMRSISSIDSRTFARIASALFGLAVLAQAARWFNASRLVTSLPDLCLVHRLFHVDCPGCGMTRALASLSRGELSHSMSLHPFAPVLLLATLGCAVMPRSALAVMARHRLVTAAAPFGCVCGILGWWFCNKVF